MQTINVGAAPDDGTGDPLRTAMIKTNDNFTEVAAVAAAAVVRAGDTMTGTLTVPNLYYDVSTQAYAGTVSLDYLADGFRTVDLTGDVFINTVNQGPVRSVTARLAAGGADRALTFDSRIRFVGTKPTSLAKDKIGIISVTSFGTAELSSVAAYSAES